MTGYRQLEKSYKEEKIKAIEISNFDGKTVIPFCTSASSGLRQS